MNKKTLFFGFGLISVCSFLLSFQTLKTNTTPMSNENYETLWKEIDSLDRQGLPKSALQKVNQLHQLSLEDKNDPQIIKSTIYIAKYTAQLNEDGLVKAIQVFRDQIDHQELSHLKAFFQSILAEAYSNYLQSNWWQLRERSNIMDFVPSDMQTWSAKNLLDEIAALYLASVEDPNLKNQKIIDFDAVLSKGYTGAELRPSLFDFLIHRAIDYFQNERSYLNKPQSTFVFNQEEAFAKADDFIQWEIPSTDTTDSKYRMLVLFQKVMKENKERGTKASALNVGLKRLKFVHTNITSNLKDQWYEAALNELIKANAGTALEADALFEKASLFVNQGQTYSAENPKYQFRLKEAKNICDEVIKNYPSSHGATNCKTLYPSILNKNLSLRVESVVAPKASILSKISYRNVSRVYLRIVDADDPLQAQPYRNRNEELNQLIKKQPKAVWSVDLPDLNDFQGHSVEIPVQQLPFGRYALLISDNEKFDLGESANGYVYFHVSNLAYILSGNEKGKAISVVDRFTGRPISGAQVEVYENDYDRILRKYKFKRKDKVVTNEEGFARISYSGNRTNWFKVTKGSDVLIEGPTNFPYYYNYDKVAHQWVHFFSDRAIYRPGQTVYFKGIALERDKNDEVRVLENKQINVTLIDANDQDVAALDLVSNRFGSIQGSFVLPRTGLKGAFALEADIDGNHSFRVEEYKRPKFEVQFDPLEKAYQLGDEVVVSGFAKGFAGNAIDGAEVNYRVTREAYYPWWSWWRWGRSPINSSGMEIANGQLKTDAEGKFEITFPATPDLSVDKKYQPAFRFVINADVVDITGETHSQTKTVRLSEQSIVINLPLGEKVDIATHKEVTITTTNLDGGEEAADLDIRVQALIQPKQVFIERFWQKPDQYLMGENDFRKRFPFYAYKDEDQKKNWQKGVLAINRKVSSNGSSQLSLESLKAAYYLITIEAKDEKGRSVQIEKVVGFYDSEKQIPLPDEHLSVTFSKNSAEPGENINIQVASAEKSYVFYEFGRDNNDIQRGSLVVSSWAKIPYRIQEKDRGGMQLFAICIRHGRVYRQNTQLAIPWSNKELKLEWMTFRDKLQPGQEEEWRVKISGPKKEKVAAEMVATLYDASLDQFVGHSWDLSLYPGMGYFNNPWSSSNFNAPSAIVLNRNWQIPYVSGHSYSFPRLEWFGFMGFGENIRVRSSGYYPVESNGAAPVPPAARMEVAPGKPKSFSADFDDSEAALEDVVVTGYAAENKYDSNTPAPALAPIRKNLKETVFFFPQMRTDEEGNIELRFTMNEALTKWKFMAVAHTKDLKVGQLSGEVLTQKELMVLPNPPRFMREGDELEYTAKVNNMTEQALTGNARLELLDANTGKVVNDLFGLSQNERTFTAQGKQSALLAWKLKVPNVGAMAITHRVIAQSGDFADGEESVLPILTNRMLVTETMPMALKGQEKKTFVFKAMDKVGQSNTLDHHSYALEFTSNPVWYAVRSLPYLMEYPYQCTEQIFSRYYANTLASGIANSYPKINQVFNQWKSADALQSKLSKNQELKALLLEETPWVMDAQSEEQQQKNIALLFDLNRMANEQQVAIDQLDERQSANGGFSWFPGGRESWYITQYLVEGMGRLRAMEMVDMDQNSESLRIAKNAIKFIDLEYRNAYLDLKEKDDVDMDADHLENLVIHYLYARSFFKDVPSRGLDEMDAYYLGQAEKYWTNKSLYQQGLLAIILQRNERLTTAKNIIQSLDERSIENEELGKYWKNQWGYYWYQMPIETQSLMIEAFAEVTKDQDAIDQMKIWLIKNKQTSHWKTTKATANAIYALMNFGDNWLSENQQVSISFPNASQEESASVEARLAKAQKTVEAGTGYFKVKWEKGEISQDYAKITIDNPNKNISWGSAYWQYFEQLDKIETFEDTPLNIKKQVFKEIITDRGPQLQQLADGVTIQAGDQLKVRIEIRVDRPMEYVHMKDMRASGLEPMEVLSRYKWQGSLGYYESPGDVATNFFIDYLPRGTYVFEYPLRAVHKGDFSNGITSIQCMYAPEFSSHSEGIRLKVE